MSARDDGEPAWIVNRPRPPLTTRETFQKKVVRPARLERATSWFVARRSIQLSYGRANSDYTVVYGVRVNPQPRGFAPRTPRHAHSRGPKPHSVRVAHFAALVRSRCRAAPRFASSTEGLRPSNSPTRSLAPFYDTQGAPRRPAHGSFAFLARWSRAPGAARRQARQADREPAGDRHFPGQGLDRRALGAIVEVVGEEMASTSSRNVAVSGAGSRLSRSGLATRTAQEKSPHGNRSPVFRPKTQLRWEDPTPIPDPRPPTSDPRPPTPDLHIINLWA